MTSNPSPAYVQRVSNVFINNGSGVRGDIKAVVKAVLLDPEALTPRNPVTSTFGKLKEPVLLRDEPAAGHEFDERRRVSTAANAEHGRKRLHVADGVQLLPGRLRDSGTNSLLGPQFGIFERDHATSRAPTSCTASWTLGASCPATDAPRCADRMPTPPSSGRPARRSTTVELTPFANNSTNLVHTVRQHVAVRHDPAGNDASRSRTRSTSPRVAERPDRTRRNSCWIDARTAVYLVAVSPQVPTGVLT